MATTILDCLDVTARRFPNKVALSDGKRDVTFQQWINYARSIGSAIIAACSGVIRRPVLVFVDRRVETLLGFMGVVASGNFYVPVDCKMPVDRMRHIINVLNPIVAITLSDADNKLLDDSGCSCVRFDINEVSTYVVNDVVLSEIHSELIDMDPVYCIFTSGSTGIPKGVLIPHRGILDLAKWILGHFDITDDDVLGNQAPFYFDGSVKDICMCIVAGATMHIIPRKCFAFPKLLGQFLNEKKVTSIWWATSAIILTADSGILELCPPQYLRFVTFGGEAIPVSQLNRWRKAVPKAVYVNLYGPTEVSVDSTYYVVNRDFVEGENVPIGSHCENKNVIVLNEEDKLVGVNEPGELCVRGTGLALGYYNNRAKTDEVFVQNPLHNFYNDKVYRTGDIVKYNEYGELVFVSRKDFQIKHMGNRVELGEIETVVSSIIGITNAACIYDKIGEKIVLYYTTEDGVERDILKLVKEKLPKYMFPNLTFMLPRMPYNANGKVDRLDLKRIYEGGVCK